MFESRSVYSQTNRFRVRSFANDLSIFLFFVFLGLYFTAETHQYDQYNVHQYTLFL